MQIISRTLNVKIKPLLQSLQWVLKKKSLRIETPNTIGFNFSTLQYSAGQYTSVHNTTVHYTLHSPIHFNGPNELSPTNKIHVSTCTVQNCTVL